MTQRKETLGAFQSWLKHNLMFPGQSKNNEVDKRVHHSEQLTAIEKLSIYQRSYYLRLLKCLQEQFPALCHALGKELFDDFCLGYLKTYPSESYTLYDLGNRFPDYLQENRPDADFPRQKQELWIDFMLDLARFELTLYMMFDAKGHEGQSFADLSTPDEQLQLQPCFQLGHYQFNVAAYYHQVREHKHTDTKNIDFPPFHPFYVCMVRKNYHTQTIPLTPIHYALLSHIKQGNSVECALNHVVTQFKLSHTKVMQSWHNSDGIRSQWIKAGVFIPK